MFTGNVILTPEFLPFSENHPSTRMTGVRWINPLEHPDWDSQLAEQNHPERSFFHSSAWANVLIETYGYKPFYFVTDDPSALHSILPLMEVNSALTGKRAIALPFTDDCAPLCANKIGFKELFRNAIELGKLRGWKYLEFRGGQRFFTRTQPSLSFYGHRLDIPSDENLFFGQLKSAIRRAIRKAEKSGVRVEISGNFDAIKSYYSLHCRARKRHGLPPQPFSFFKCIQKHVLEKNLGIVVLARWRKIPIAGAVFFFTGGHAIYKFGASDEAYQHLRGNNLVFWEAIQWLSRCGAKKLDLGRTSIANEGLRRFKLGWNADEQKIEYFRFSLQQKKFISTGDESSGWHNKVFRTLPLSMSRMIGRALYRHWA